MSSSHRVLEGNLIAFRDAVRPVNSALHQRIFETMIAAAESESARGDDAAIAILRAAIAAALGQLGSQLTYAETIALLHDAETELEWTLASHEYRRWAASRVE